MPDPFVIGDIAAVLAERQLPAVTVYNRLEGRPRTREFDRALRAEVRDALWMLTRQWQVGEFHGDDAGSPVLARLQLAERELTGYRPRDGAPEPFDDTLPLEARVERRPLPLSLDVRLLMGRQWLKLVDDAVAAGYRDAFTDAFPFTMPVPDADDAERAAHPEVWQAFAAVAGRSMDGGALYVHLTAAAGNRPTDGIGAIPAADRPLIDALAGRFVTWFERLFLQAPEADRDAWDAQRLEYRFVCSAADKVYTADEYHGGHPDWWSFDVAPDTIPPIPSAAPGPPGQPRTVIPTPVRFEGMPDTRWWAFEDGRTNFGDVDAATTDVAKLLLLEFGLVYANDWFVIPAQVNAGRSVDVTGLSVTTVFGERFWIEAAGAGPDDAWQRWSMFTVSVRGTDPTQAADTALLLPPTVPKVQESNPTEDIALVRDEMANMVWAVERTVPLATGASKPGAEAASEKVAFLQALLGPIAPPPELERTADATYELMSSVPEHWIPFVAVHVAGQRRQIQLQRAGLPRLLNGDPNPSPPKVEPRTRLLREGLDATPRKGYLLHEEEVPREGTRVTQTYHRTRWRDGRAIVWLGVGRGPGRGEGSSGLVFDELAEDPPEAPDS
jgi:hypothetical protein